MKKKNKSATTMMWVEYWVEHVDPSQDMFEIWADELQNGKWKCEIELPLINQTVKSISTTQVNAMKNALEGNYHNTLQQYNKAKDICEEKFGKDHIFISLIYELKKLMALLKIYSSKPLINHSSKKTIRLKICKERLETKCLATVVIGIFLG